MLELLIGTDHIANTDEVLRRLSGDVASRREGCILLVPELISHDMERRLCAVAGDTASRYAEVLSFTRLARRVSDAVGSAPMDCLDNGGRLVAMAAATRQLHSKLKAYASVQSKPEFLTLLVDAVDEFKRCCISAEDLMAASLRAEGALAQKLEELSLLLQTYDSLCQNGKRDPRELMDWVLEELEDSDFAAKRIFYIDGFPDLTVQNLAVLEHLICQSPQVVVSLNCDEPDSKRMAFEKPGHTALQMIRLATKHQIPWKITPVAPRDTPLKKVTDVLFQGAITPNPAMGHVLTLRTADSVYEECQAAAKDILELVRGGVRYRDISLVCTDMTAYRSALSLVFRRAGIPVYLSGTEEVLENGAVTTLLWALEAALSGFEQKAVLRYLRSVLSPISAETCDLVENYVIVWGITGKKFEQPWTAHPDGFSGVWNSHFQRMLERIETARQSAMEPLIRLAQRLRCATKLEDQIRALYDFLEDTQFAERLEKLAWEQERYGNGRGAQILNQLWEIILSAMEQMHDVLGQTVWDGEVFQRLFILLLSQYDVGTIPTVLDAVTVGPVTAMRCQRCKHLFVLGAKEGSLPGYGGVNGVLTNQERTALRNLEVPLTGGALDGIQTEFSEVYGVFYGASEHITVSCPTAEQSYIYRRLRELVGTEEKAENCFVTNEPRDAAYYLARWDCADGARELGLEEEFSQALRRRAHDLGIIGRKNVTGLYGEKLMLSASKVDRQAECRLSFFLKYGLRARERKEATVDPAEFGTYVHDVLENTAREVINLGGFHQVSCEQTLEIAKRYSDAYVGEHFSDLYSSRMEYLFRRNMQELDLIVRELWEELSTGKYEPVEFELHFGEGGPMAPIHIPSKSMLAELEGYVDRVDAWRLGDAGFFRVVDYKTGSKDFDYCDVFNGVGLQMLLYLFALEQEGEQILGNGRIAAGVQYFPARVPYVNLGGAGEDEQDQRRKNWIRQGLLLADDLSLEAMDPELTRLCCARKKDGTMTGDLASREQLKLLRQYVFRILGRMVDDIASGNVQPNPYTRGTSHNACQFCPYQPVCHSDSVPGRRNYKAMKQDRFWYEIGKELDDHG